MKKLLSSNIFWVIFGIIVGVIISIFITNFSMQKMAPADFRDHDDLDGVLIASASNVLQVSSVDEGIFYEPSKEFPTSERFTIEMEHNDPGMLITDFPKVKGTEIVTI